MGPDYGKAVEDRLKPSTSVRLYYNTGGSIIVVGHAVVQGTDAEQFVREANGRRFPQGEQADYVMCFAFRFDPALERKDITPVLNTAFQHDALPKTPSTLNEFGPHTEFLWDTRAMRQATTEEETAHHAWCAKYFPTDDQPKKDAVHDNGTPEDLDRTNKESNKAQKTDGGGSKNTATAIVQTPIHRKMTEKTGTGSEKTCNTTLNKTKTVRTANGTDDEGVLLPIHDNPILYPSSDTELEDGAPIDVDDNTATEQKVKLHAYNRESYNYDMVRVHFADLLVQDDRIRLRPVNEAHVARTLELLKSIGSPTMYGRISATIHPDDYPADGNVEALFEYDAEYGNRPKTHVRLIIIDGNHRYVAISRLRANMDPAHEWTRRRIEIFLVVRKDGKPLTQHEILKHGQLLNTATSHSLPCTTFLDILRTVISYANSFEAEYHVPFVEARTRDIQDDLVAANFIPRASVSTYRRYIHVAKLCCRYTWLPNLIESLNNRVPLQGNTSTTRLTVSHLADNTLRTSPPPSS